MSPLRRAERYADVSALGVTALLLVTVMLGVTSPARTLLALAFVTFVPGWALLRHVRIVDGTARIALAVALSLVICTAFPLVSLWLRWWEPMIVLDVLAAASALALLAGMGRHDRTEGAR